MMLKTTYVVEGHLAEQSVHQLVHFPGGGLQRRLLHQHLSGFLQPALQHVTHHLPDTKHVTAEISHGARYQNISAQSVCVLYLQHPSSHGAQQGSRFAALLWPSHPHQPCVTSPSRGGGAAGNPLRTRTHTQTHTVDLCQKRIPKNKEEINYGYKVKLTRSSFDEQHFTQIPDQFYGQQNGHLSERNRS